MPAPLGADVQAPEEPDTRFAGEGLLDYSDYKSVRTQIYDGVKNAVSKAYPISNDRYTLTLQNAGYAGKETYSLKEQKKALLEGKSLTRRLVGSWDVTDNETGSLVSRSKAQTIMNVPYLTGRGTYIRNGTEYTVNKQFRLTPSVYSKKTDDGRYESQFNFKQGTGSNFRVFMEPESSVFYMKYRGRKIPMLPVMAAMGYDKDELKKRWGDEVYDKNAATMSSPHAVNFIRSFAKTETPIPKAKLEKESNDYGEVIRENLLNTFSRGELDGDAVETSLGVRHETLSPGTMADASSRLLSLSRGESENDDRDSLEYQTVHDMSDFLAEKISKDQNRVSQKVLWKLTGKQGQVDSIPTGHLDAHVKYLFNNSGVAQGIEEINPMDYYDQNQRVTRMGEGAMTSMDSIPKECFDTKTEVFTDKGWVLWEDVTEGTLFACDIQGQMEFKKAHSLTRQEYKGKMYGLSSRTIDYLVTPNHRMLVEKYRKDRSAPLVFERADETHRKPRMFPTGGVVKEGTITSFTPPMPTVRKGGTIRSLVTDVDIRTWGAFLGWYLSEGGIDSYALRVLNKYHITISQSREANPDKCAEIESILNILGIKWSYQGHNFVFGGNQLGRYLHSLGVGASGKSLPKDILSWTTEGRQALLDAYIKGDGHRRGPKTGASITTCSAALYEGLNAVAISLGYATKQRKAVQRETHKWNTQYVLGLPASTMSGVVSTPQYENYYTVDYDDMVYCASVPGERLLVRREGQSMWTGNSRDVQPSYMNFVDPIRSPESMKIGVDMRMARNVRKGKDNKLYTQFINARTGQKEWVDSRTAARANVATPDSMKGDGKFVASITAKGVNLVGRDEVDFVVPSGDDMFSEGANLVPMKSGVKGMRLLMGSKFMAQALPLVSREAPLVRTSETEGSSDSVEKKLGTHMGAVRANGAGEVLSVSRDGVKVKYDDGAVETHELYDNMPFSRKTYLRNTSRVKKGDKIKEGQLLASSNYTDDKGNTALGTNLRVSYMNYDGKVFEDAIVISSDAAKKLTSEHMYTEEFEEDKDTRMGLEKYMAVYPNKFDHKQLKTLDDKGIVKTGTILKYGDPMVLAFNEKQGSATMGRKVRGDASQTWKHKFPGVVTDTAKTKKGWNVGVRANVPMMVGDKLSGRYGDKGVISDIIDIEKMPRDAQGRPVDVILSPLGVISRTNSSQLLEAQLGKIAQKTGKPYVVDGFSDDDMVEFVQKELEANNMTDVEDMHDPSTGKSISGIFTGNRFFQKLQHTSEGKGKARATGGYTEEGLPSKGGKTGSKTLGVMEVQALLGHGATKVLKDMKLVKGQRNDMFWRDLKLGRTPKMPETPEIYDKFKEMMRGAGISFTEGDEQDNIQAMTNTGASKLTGDRELTNANTYSQSGFKPMTGGLFDPKLTGSLDEGKRWSFISLPEPMVNPIMEDPIRSILGMTKKEWEAGVREGSVNEKIQGINLKKETALALDDIKNGSRSKRPAAVKKFRFLHAMSEQKVHPKDYLMDRVPVLPPKYRPITQSHGMNMVNDANYLYKGLMESVEDYNDSDGLTEDIRRDSRKLIYDNYKSTVGLTDPVQADLQQKGVSGILKNILGKGSPKAGFIQRRVIGTNLDATGLAVITPNPSLTMNQVGLPEGKAWDLYEPFIVRNLVQSGMPAMQAAKAVEGKSEVAYKALKEVATQRPVLINRAPTLHKYGIMAAWPVLTKGHSLQIPPALVGPFGADFDGDTMSYSVPVSKDAVDEAVEKMMPDKNLLSSATDTPNYAPTNEYLQGLYFASKQPGKKKETIKFASKQDALKAFMKGTIKMDDPISIKEK
jgi:DNA-directed RNA polymerase beta subunit